MEVVDSLESIALKNEVSLKFREPNSDCLIRGDRDSIRQVFHNLVDNAIKYNVSGGTVEVTCECKNQNVAVELRDTGRGIAPDELPRVFERFFRGRADKSGPDSNGSNACFAGSGLGLSIVRRIVTNHGGECTAESQVGGGTTFFVKLPGTTLA